ncbi:TPA: helix-turn-helix transcriptional regulator [Streptococcus suis]|nr:helix-turn-helix transcriptional regulator [Streptococcus suis]
MKDTIENRLRDLRREKKLTQDELAFELNKNLTKGEKLVSKMTISNWENNKHAIKPDKAQKLAEYFGVSVGYLLGYSDKPDIFEDEEVFQDNDGHLYAISFKRTSRQYAENSLKELVLYLSDNGFYLSNHEIITLWENLFILSVNHGDDLKTRLFQEVRKDPTHPEREKLEKDYSLVLNYVEGEELPLKLDFE